VRKSLRKRLEKTMPFLDHLEELRSRLIISIVSVGAAFTISWTFLSEEVLRIVERDFLGGMKLVALTPLAAALARMRISLMLALLISSPVWAYEILAFVLPALKPGEKRLAAKIIAPALILMVLGVSFGYFVMVPTTIDFLKGMLNQDLVTNMWSVDQTISFVFLMLVVFGLIFEYPLAIAILSNMGVVSPQTLKKNRPIALIAILVVAAVITPDPTMVSQIIVSIPMYILYEVGILCSSALYPKQRAT